MTKSATSGQISANRGSKGRQAILESSLALFAEFGYGRVSLRDIAKRAQVSLTLVDHHFGAKHELFDGLVESLKPTVEGCVGPLREVLAKGLAEGADVRVLDALFESLRLLSSQPQGNQLVWLALRSRFEDDARVSEAAVALFMPISQAFIDALAVLHPRLSHQELAWVYLLALAPLVERNYGQNWVRGIVAMAPGDQPELDPAITRAYVLAGVRGYLDEAERRRRG